MSHSSVLAGAEPLAILLCTLGMTWAVVPEIFGFVAPEQFDFYRDHPQRDRLRQQTATFPRPGAADEVTAMRELILRAVLAASERATPDRLLLSLAGGRKTMSADRNGPGPCSVAGRCCTSLTWSSRCPRRCSNPIRPGWLRH